IESPWQNGIAERWVGSCRREILDHVIALDERHLLRLMRDYISYHHQDRLHDSLEKDTPDHRAIEPKPAASAKVTSMPHLGGLHHRYCWRGAAQKLWRDLLPKGYAQDDARRRMIPPAESHCDLPGNVRLNR